MVMPNPFSDPAYSVTSMTQAINFLPNRYSRITDMGIFRNRGISTQTFVCEERSGQLTMLPAHARGAPGPGIGREDRKLRYFGIPHIPLGAYISPEEVMDTRPFGQETGQESLSQMVTDRLQAMRDNHDITKEYMMVRALQGEVVDGERTLIYDLFNEFEVTRQTFDFQFSNANIFPRTEAVKIRRWYEQNSYGAVYTGLLVLTSPEFWDALIEHPHVRDFYLAQAQAGEMLRNDLRPSYSTGGLTFSEYFGTGTAPDGTVYPFIEPGEAICFPTGGNFFEMINGPADFNDTHGAMGEPYYARIEEGEFNRGWKVHTQCNPLPICYRPALLTRITQS